MLLTLENITFTWEDLLTNTKKSRRREPGSEMKEAAEKAYEKGLSLLDLKAVYEIYDVEGVEGNNLMTLRAENNAFTERIYIGPRINYLSPAVKAVVGLCTAGSPIVEAMDKYSSDEEYLLMYYLDVFAVKALGELSEKLRKRVEEIAAAKGWGVGPSMQPGSVTGWDFLFSLWIVNIFDTILAKHQTPIRFSFVWIFSHYCFINTRGFIKFTFKT